MNQTQSPAVEQLFRRYSDKSEDDSFLRNEAQIRGSLVAPFFRDALGWPIEDPDEFRFEAPIAGKRADIVACLGGIAQFVIEVKSLRHDIFDNAEYYRQAIQYADGMEKQYAILTNFREWVLLRTDFEARNQNWLSLEAARYTLDELRHNLGLLRLFHRDVWKGDRHELQTLDLKFQQSYRRRKPVDERLLELFVSWRTSCLSWLKKNRRPVFEAQSPLAVEEEVQRYLDRIVFITSCEDREIEDRRLRQFIGLYASSLRIEGHAVTKGIRDIFAHYYSRYDSDLFDRGLADQFQFDDSITYGILRDIKAPAHDLPFDFSFIAPDILGKTYENFIGHLIRGRAQLEEVADARKRKQEGIFYTPQWVVDQIVSRAVRPHLAGKGLAELREVRILDPACGSGTFLVAAFRELLRHGRAAAGRELSYDERRKLFLSCIYGVDKDDRACDIAKLNVSLLMAEKGRLLPSLSQNIRCADSLIGREVAGYAKAGRWETRFPEVFKRVNPGFDVIIGNPPYLSAKDFEDGAKYEDVLRQEFGQVKDLYYLFLRLNDRLIREGGTWSFIVPDTFFTLSHYRDVRELLRSRYQTVAIDLSPNVFPDAYVFNAIVVASRVSTGPGKLEVGYLAKESTGAIETRPLSYSEISTFPKMPIFLPTPVYESVDKRFLRESGKLSREFERELTTSSAYRRGKDRIQRHAAMLRPGDVTLLGIIAEGSQGLVTGNNSRYLGTLPVSAAEREGIWEQFLSKLGDHSRDSESRAYSPRVAEQLYERAEELKRRRKEPTLFGKKFLYRIVDQAQVTDFNSLSEKQKLNGIAPGGKKWVLYFRGNEQGDVWRVRNPEYIEWTTTSVEELKGGEVTNSRWQGAEYFSETGFGWVDYFDQRIKGFYIDPTVYGKNVVKFHSEFLPDEYILGLLNSSFVSYYVKRYITNTRTLQVNDGKLIPIVVSDSRTTASVVELVKAILRLKDESFQSRDDRETSRIMAHLGEKERELDYLVLHIYGLDPARDANSIADIRGTESPPLLAANPGV